MKPDYSLNYVVRMCINQYLIYVYAAICHILMLCDIETDLRDVSLYPSESKLRDTSSKNIELMLSKSRHANSIKTLSFTPFKPQCNDLKLKPLYQMPRTLNF